MGKQVQESRKEAKAPPWEATGPSLDLVKFIEAADIEPGSKVLDVGCGAGVDAAYLASLGFGVTGIDVSPTAVSSANDNAKGTANCTFFVAGIFQPGFNRDVFDLVCDRGCFHNISHSK